TTLRSAESGLVVDHVRAVFAADQPADPGAPAGTAAAGPRRAGAALVDGGELYGTVCFQAGRFRRIAGLPELTARSCRALARGPDDRAWFPPGGDGAGPGSDGLLLGSPGLNDALLQALQACVPDRRVWPAAIASVTFSGAAAAGEVEIRAVAAARRPAGPPVPVAVTVAGGPAGRGVLVPPPAPSPDADGMAPATELTWDVTAVDGGGAILAAWRGVVLREAGALPRGGPWPLALLPAYLESAALRLGLDPDLRITAAADGPARPPGGGAGVPPPRPAEPAEAGGLALTAGGAGFAACGWAPADPRHPVWPAGDAGQAATFSRLCSHLSEPPVASAARLQAAAACLARAGAPADAPLTFERAAADGWAVLAAGGARLACTVVEVAGLPGPVAIAIMTDSPRPALRGRPVRGGGARRRS
ncbi:MAG TPA: hypothetical protein VFX25_28340, partial [Streptosporangiaceae bacterium]|nr:hypothetical protein [Streptosporangiaceae bacterium]